MPQPAARRRAAIIAGHTGDAALAATMLSDSDADVRASALNALHRLGTLTTDAHAQAASDPSPTVRRRAATIAGELRTAALPALLNDEDDSVVEVACWAAGEHPADGEVLDLLIRIGTEHDDPLCRESAIAALGAIGDDRGLPTILAGCSDKLAVRRRAVLALAPFDGPEVEAALAKALTDRDWQVRQAAEDLT